MKKRNTYTQKCLGVMLFVIVIVSGCVTPEPEQVVQSVTPSSTVIVATSLETTPTLAEHLLTPTPLPSLVPPTPRITPTAPTPITETRSYDPQVPLLAENIALATTQHFDIDSPITFHAWSPDGERLLFSQSEQPYTLVQSGENNIITRFWPDLWVMTTDGTSLHKLTDWGGTLTWSPDGQSVAFIAPVESAGIAGMLSVVDLAQSETHTVVACDIGRTFDLFWLNTDEIVCRQNGIMYATKRDGSVSRQLNSIFTSDIVQGPDGEVLPAIYQGYYHISPDGEQIAYIKTGLPPTFWVANVDGSNAIEITGNHHVSIDVAAWSPDSSQLAYTVYNGKGRLGTDIWIVNADGSNAHPVAVAEQEDTQCLEPTWSPDGNVLAYTYKSNLPDEPEAVWVINVDGTEAHLLIDLAFAPHWSPNGNEIAVLRRSAIFDQPESLLVHLSLGQ